MTIEPIKQRNGVSRATAICDECGRREVVACAYSHETNKAKSEPNQSQARAKVIKIGWSYAKGTLRCQACEAARKVVKMPVKKAASPSREPTKAENRQILKMLDECYDTEAERYSNGDTDDTLAEVLGVMPGWVGNLREEHFGPDGSNDNIEDLAKRFEELRASLTSQISAETAFTGKKIAALETIKGMATELAKIKTAVGPRIQKRAGV